LANPLVRFMKTPQEFRECEAIQQEVWGTVAASGELLGVTQKCGGVVLGAFVGRKFAGFLFALLARRKGRLIHWSHMMAVREGFRDLGLGLRMKLLHRKVALADGIKSICWTFDPLQSRNAYFNIARLGVSIEEYIVDCYGRFPSAIERGLPSDRLVANWQISSRHVARRLREGPQQRDITAIPRANAAQLNARGFLECRKLERLFNHRRVLIEIPSNTDEMRSADLNLATRWRMESRKLFERYLGAGYGVEDFVAPREATAGRCFYVLRR